MEQLMESPRTVFTIFGIPVTETVVNTWVVMVILIAFAWWASRRPLKEYPGKIQNAIEAMVEAFNGLVTTTMGEKGKGFMPYISVLFLFIGFANLSALIGLRAPTSDINVTAGLALITFGAINFYGLKFNKFKHIKGLAEPVFLFLPMNIISEIAKPFSLAMRLFGNVIGGAIIMAMIAGGVAVFVPVFPSLYFDVFSGLLQSLIFMMLTMVYISIAIE